MKQLIVAADDFGLTESVNEGIERAHERGIVTSVNLLPAGRAFDDALKRASSMGLREAGAHLALTEIAPVSPLSAVPSLVGRDGNFYRGRAGFLLRVITGAISLDEVYVEWRAQLNKAASSGLDITNLSGHEHVHMLPAMLDIFIKLAKEYDIPAIRYPHADRSYRRPDPKIIYKWMVLASFEKRVGRALKSSGIISPEHFLGVLDSGNITESMLLEMVAGLDEGATELVCHPGFLGKEVIDRHKFHRNSETELFALTSERVKKAIEKARIRLVGYREFISAYQGRT